MRLILKGKRLEITEVLNSVNPLMMSDITNFVIPEDYARAGAFTLKNSVYDISHSIEMLGPGFRLGTNEDIDKACLNRTLPDEAVIAHPFRKLKLNPHVTLYLLPRPWKNDITLYVGDLGEKPIHSIEKVSLKGLFDR